MYISMNNYEKLLQITDNDTIHLADSFKELLHKKLCLGMTRYVCRNGTLSDGHEKITPAQRYFQSIKEMHGLASNIRLMKIQAMEYQADLLDAEVAWAEAKSKSEELRAQSKLLMAQEKILGALITVEDQMRQLDEFNKVRQELEEFVESKYPDGIEQSEEDNWTAVAEYRSLLRQLGNPQNMTHVPLSQKKKAEVGLANNAIDLAAWMLVDSKAEIEADFGGDFKKFLEAKFTNVNSLEHKGALNV